jgi:hypothetical protein
MGAIPSARAIKIIPLAQGQAFTEVKVHLVKPLPPNTTTIFALLKEAVS